MYKVRVVTKAYHMEFFCSTLHGAKCKARRILRSYAYPEEAYIRKGDTLVAFCTALSDWKTFN